MACPPFYNLMKSIPLNAPMMRFKTNTPTIDAVVELVREFSNLPNGSRLHRRDNKGGNKKEDVTFELVCDPSIEPTAIHKLWNSTRNDNEGRQEDAEGNKMQNDEMDFCCHKRKYNELIHAFLFVIYSINSNRISRLCS